MKDATRSHRESGRKFVRMNVVALIAGLLITVVLAAGCAGDEEAGDQATDQDAQRTAGVTTERTQARDAGEATLEMRGDESVEFSGSCAVGDRETEIGGQVPESYTYELDGERLDCEIRKESGDGNLQVILTAGENTRSVQQISGGTLNLTYEKGRISSFSSTSGGSSSSSSQSSSSIHVSS